MENIKRAKLLLSEMALAIGMQSLELDDSGYCAIVIEDENVLHLQFYEQSNSLLLLTAIGEYPDESIAEQVLTEVLKANFMWSRTYGSTLAIDPEGLSITLQEQINLDNMNASDLAQATNEFANFVGIWKLEYQNILDKSEE